MFPFQTTHVPFQDLYIEVLTAELFLHLVSYSFIFLIIVKVCFLVSSSKFIDGKDNKDDDDYRLTIATRKCSLLNC